MSSREIAELVESRHDSVKRAIERLADREVIEFPPSVEIPTATKPVTVYQIGKRDSYVIVAQLSPEFTARLVDRWQELEAGLSAEMHSTPVKSGRFAITEAFSGLVRSYPEISISPLSHR
jgi:phage regulator Rha-like protein